LAGVALSIGGFFVTVERPGHFFSEKWRSFKVLPENEQTESHFLTLGSNRYDFWRVALHEFERHPIAGIGSRGFATAYLRKGQSNETPQRAHSLELDQLAETGIVGFALLAASILVPLLAIARRARGSLLACGLLGAGTYWLAHATVDWTWTFPAATLPAFLLLGLGVGRADTGRSFRGTLPTAAAAVILALLVFAPPWLANRLTVHASASSDGAAAQLRWARRLDPLSTAPLFAQARLAGSPGDIAYLRKAVEKEPRRPEGHYHLGLAYLEAGQREAGRRELQEALRLNPRDELIANALAETG
jgi:tetratricopeptide (TPR) repeat protein